MLPKTLCICTVANELLDSETAEEATEKFGGLLDQTFKNDSFAKTIISGGVSEEFEGNITRKAWLFVLTFLRLYCASLF